jgi:hypothetical protein
MKGVFMGGDTDDRGTLGGVVNEEEADALYSEAFNAAAEGISGTAGSAVEELAGQDSTAGSGEDSTGGDGEPPDNAATPIPGDDQKFEQKYKTLQGIHKKDREAWAKREAELQAEMEALKKPPEVKVEPVVEKKETISLADFKESLTTEQKEALEEYERDFDIVSKMEGLKRDAAMAKLMKEIASFKEDILLKLTPTQELVTEISREREVKDREDHFAMIRDAHPDFEKFRDDGSILKWIETKPAYLKRGMLDVYRGGTAEEAIGLIQDFKLENGISMEEPKPNERTEQRRQALSAVKTRKTPVNPAVAVHTDFESAFDEASSK